MTENIYRFSTAIVGHTSDVRCVTVTQNGDVITGSRDMSAKLWKREAPNSRDYREASTITCHNNFVSSVCYLPPNGQHPNGVIITGSNDKKIRLFELNETIPFKVLQEHTNTVCKLVPGINGWAFLSASWDMTARAWKEVDTEWISVTLSGHLAAVWSVCQLSSGIIVTASADKTLQVYDESGAYQIQLAGHTDCVRDVVAAGPYEVLSVANDSTVRCWNVNKSNCTHVFTTHQNFIYSIALLDGLGWVTGGEDKSVKIWGTNGEIQSIVVPCSSVWSVAVLPNSDIVAASDDGVVRIFSKDPERIADAQTLAGYDEIVAKSIIDANPAAASQPVKLNELPGQEALTQPGKSDGQSKVVRIGNKAIAYSWSATKATWEEVGEVMGYGDSDRMHNGKEYDYVFSVDIEDGKPPLKLPYNKTDDPWVAANKFLEENFLPLSYLEQVANFITNCIGKSSQSTAVESNSGFVDPFTGASRYVPVSNGSSASVNATVSNMSAKNLISSQYFPQKDYLRFDQFNITAIKDKILKLNHDNNLNISENAISSLLDKCDLSTPCLPEDFELLERLLKWPSAYVFPVLDTIRLLIREPSVSNSMCNDLIPKLQEHLGGNPNNMLIFRIFSNMISTPAGENCALKNMHYLLMLIASEPATYTKPVEIAMATLILNIAVLLHRRSIMDHKQEVLMVCRDLLSEFNDDEAIFRVLVALGTIITSSPNQSEDLQTFHNILQKISANPTQRIAECSKRLLL